MLHCRARSIGIPEESIGLLVKNEVDGACLRELSQDDLRDLGIIVLGQYKKILRQRDVMLSSSSSSSSLLNSPVVASSVGDDDDNIASEDLVPIRKLGGGHFGEVWLMMWCKTTKVAVKWLKGGGLLAFSIMLLFFVEFTVCK
jgi:hypothetical protein